MQSVSTWPACARIYTKSGHVVNQQEPLKRRGKSFIIRLSCCADLKQAWQGVGAALVWPWPTNGREQQTTWRIGALMLTFSSPSGSQETPLAPSSCLEDSEYL